VPELPEVEVVRRGIAGEATGSLITSLLPTGARTFRRHPPDQLAAHLEGHRIERVDRHGKYLLLRVDGQETLVVHLGMSGQLLAADAGPDRPPHTHLVVGMGGRELRFVDPRTFGEVFVTDGHGRPAELAHLGFDPLVDRMTPARFAALLAARRMQIKALLLSQRVVAGIGNIYADEILWAAGIRPDRLASDLGADEAAGLLHHMRAVLRTSVRLGGSTLSDGQYVDVSGTAGTYQTRHNAYGREGVPCARCASPIRRIRWGGRSTFFCMTCQR